MSNIIRGFRAAGIGLGLLAALGAGTVSAQNAQDQEVPPHVQAVIDQFAGLVPIMAEAGYPNFEVLSLEGLNSGASASLQYTAADSSPVFVVGACDNDCTDLDLRVRSGNRLVGEDVLDDAMPVVEVPAGGRPLTIETSMAACSVDPCVYGVVVFRK